jgi:hypothetical protein
VRLVGSFEQAYQLIPLDSVDLYLNGSRVESGTWFDQFGNERPSKMKVANFPTSDFGPFGKYRDQVPLTFCWIILFPSGLSVAEIRIHSEQFGLLSYQWAFNVIDQ